MASRAASVLGELEGALPELERTYRDLHRHPELSFAENRTAAIGTQWLRDAGYDVTTGVGGTGVVGVLSNGDGPTVLLRADMDALPVREQTGLPYASEVTTTNADGIEVPVAHACGHDMHVTWLLGAARLLAARQQHWSGTLQVVLQPAEEVGGGADGMISDGIFERCGTPDFVFGQHIGPMPAGQVFTRPGLTMSATDAFRVRMFGRGGHASRPETTVDPVVMAAATVMRLQAVVSREVSATDSAVVTVGSLQAGTKDNIIPDEAVLTINIRSFTPAVRERVVAAVKRIVRAESDAAGATREPEFTTLEDYPATVNDETTTNELAATFLDHFGPQRTLPAPLVTGSEDFGAFGVAAEAPSVFWFVGGVDAAEFVAASQAGTVDADIPSNHSPHFAPVLHPTLSTGVETLVVAALSKLAE